jgi:hypothetical protein
MRILSLAALILVARTGLLYGQSFENLENRQGDNPFAYNGFHVFLRYTHVSAKYTESYGGMTVNVSYRNDYYNQWEPSWHFENPTLGDLIYLLFNTEEMNGRATEQAYGSGFLGWHQVYLNAVAKPNLLLSPGLSFGDYIFGSKRAATNNPRTLDPAGYFLHLGPAFKVSYLLNEKYWVDGFFNYDIGFKVGSPSQDYQEVKGYEKPHFLNLGGEIHSVKTRLFGGARLNTLIDRGSSKDAATRLDFSVGYMF